MAFVKTAAILPRLQVDLLVSFTHVSFLSQANRRPVAEHVPTTEHAAQRRSRAAELAPVAELSPAAARRAAYVRIGIRIGVCPPWSLSESG